MRQQRSLPSLLSFRKISHIFQCLSLPVLDILQFYDNFARTLRPDFSQSPFQVICSLSRTADLILAPFPLWVSHCFCIKCFLLCLPFIRHPSLCQWKSVLSLLEATLSGTWIAVREIWYWNCERIELKGIGIASMVEFLKWSSHPRGAPSAGAQSLFSMSGWKHGLLFLHRLPAALEIRPQYHSIKHYSVLC